MNPNELKRAHDSLELFDLKKLTNYDNWIAAIQSVQLNAYRAGMTEAAEICRNPQLTLAGEKICDNILSARDRKDLSL